MKRPLGMFIPLAIIAVLSAVPFLISLIVLIDFFFIGVADGIAAGVFLFTGLLISVPSICTFVGAILSLRWSKKGFIMLGIGIGLLGYLAFKLAWFKEFHIYTAINATMYGISLIFIFPRWKHFR